MTFVNLLPGDPAPWFWARSTTNPRYAFHSVGGRYIVLCFFGSIADPRAQAAVSAALAKPNIFNDEMACFFGITNDFRDETRLEERVPGYRFFLDFDRDIARRYGVVPRETSAQQGGREPVRRLWVVLDPTLRVLRVVPFNKDGSDVQTVMTYLERLPPPGNFAGTQIQAPVLYLPNVFEPELCQKLIGLYETHGGQVSGFMRDLNGKTAVVHDPGHKRRRDYSIEDQAVVGETQSRFMRRIVPEIAKAFQFRVTRMERYIVCCYSEEDRAHFRAHRDNTTKGTAHRRFAVSVNLNDDFDGGEVSFPEYGPRSFKPPPGGAVVFSCSLLHAVSEVTRGRRYVFLPFLYDDEAAKIREQNSLHLADERLAYAATPSG